MLLGHSRPFLLLLVMLRKVLGVLRGYMVLMLHHVGGHRHGHGRDGRGRHLEV